MFSFSKWKANIYTKYSKDPGNMLVHTGVIGWILSSAAQVFAIVFNDKISPEQKMFLIPQEIADGGVNILSFYAFTSGIKYIGAKLTKTCKLRTAELSKLLKERGLILEKGEPRVKGKVYAGDWDFDITKLKNYKRDFEGTFKPFNNGAEVIAGLTGSIISSNLISPVAKNSYASKRQKDMIASMKKGEQPSDSIPPLQRISINNFANNAYSKMIRPSGNLKV